MNGSRNSAPVKDGLEGHQRVYSVVNHLYLDAMLPEGKYSFLFLSGNDGMCQSYKCIPCFRGG